MPFWSSDIAYAIGLIATDGNLSKDKRHISLTSTDKQLLNTFKKCLNIRNRICNNPSGNASRKQCFKVTFGNVVLYKKLLKIGLMPNKTFNMGSLEIPNKFLPDFLRGHIDGDGSIIRYVDKHNSYKFKTYTYIRLYVAFHCASLRHISWIRDGIYRNLGIKGSLNGWKNLKRSNVKTHWTLRFCKKESLILLPYLFYKKKLPCLQRKRSIALSFLRYTASSWSKFGPSAFIITFILITDKSNCSLWPWDQIFQRFIRSIGFNNYFYLNDR